MDLTAQIAAARTSGRTTCATARIAANDDEISAADRLVLKYGFRTPEAGWLAISAAEAHAIVSTLLHRDLAYGEETMPLSRAEELATQFFDLAPEPHSYFTNGDWEMSTDGSGDPSTLRGWDPLSDATFDSGVVCIGDGTAALLWVEDED